MMTSRERVLAAVNHQPPDRTPMDFGGTKMSECTPEFLEMFRNFLDVPVPDDRHELDTWVDESIQKFLGVDLRLVPPEPPLPVLRDLDPPAYEARLAGYRKRKKSLREGKRTYAVRHEAPLANHTCEDIKALKPSLPEPSLCLNWQIGTAKKFRAAGYATTFWVSGGFFELGCMARGYDTFAMDLMLNPDIVKALFDLWLEEKLHKVKTTIRPLAPYIDIFCFGDDWALQNGPFMSPNTFHEVIAPYFDIHYAKVHEAAPNSKLFHHSCGSIYKLLDEIISIGVDILNPIQPNAVDMGPDKLKQKVNNRLCLHGGIDLQHLLPYGTPEDVLAETERRQAILGEGGGYICAPAHSLPEDVPQRKDIRDEEATEYSVYYV